MTVSSDIIILMKNLIGGISCVLPKKKKNYDNEYLSVPIMYYN